VYGVSLRKRESRLPVQSRGRSVSVFGPGRAIDRRVNLCCVLHNPDGDAKRIHGGYPGSGKEGPTSSGREEYCISLHRSTCVGVTSCERGSRSQVSRKE
jgi:hypothetical protein